MDHSGIYIIENAVNGKAYVGSAINLRTRRNQHRSQWRRGLHCNQKLQRAFNKYGDAALEFRTLLICAPDGLLFYEQRVLDAYGTMGDAGYNICTEAGSIRGYKRGAFSAEHRAKLSAARKTRPKATRSDEQRARMSAAQKVRHARDGYVPRRTPVSEETGRKISAALTGKKLSAQHRANIGAAKRACGYEASDETRKKLSAATRAAWMEGRRVR